MTSQISSLENDSFAKHAQNILGNSTEAIQKIELINKIRTQLQDSLIGMKTRVKSNEDLNDSLFLELFSEPILRLSEILTDDEFCQIFDADKKEFKSLMQFIVTNLG